MEINERQKKILMAVIAEFMETADEVGSSYLVKKYGFDFSSATVRSEMLKLMDQGLLEQSHISAGRVPSDQAIRMYVLEQFDKGIVEAVDLIQIRQGLFKVRFYPEQLIKVALNLLMKYSACASFVLMEDTTRYYGVSSLMKYRELRDVQVVERILDILEDENMLKRVFSRYDGNDVSFIIGSEFGIKDMEHCAIMFTKIPFWGNQYGHMGVIGSRRMNYPRIANLLSIVRESLNESLKGWQ